MKDTKKEVINEINKMYKELSIRYIPCPICKVKVKGGRTFNNHIKQHKKLIKATTDNSS